MNTSRLNRTGPKPTPKPAPKPARTGRRGISLTECMISLAICSGLLSAVAVAFRTSFGAVALNDQHSRATQSSRVTMNHVLAEIRRANSVQVSADRTQLDVIRAEAVRLPNEVYRSYKFDPSGRKLTVQTFFSGGTSGPLYTLSGNVDSAEFGPAETAPGSTTVVRVPVRVEVRVDRSTIVLNGTAAPRQAIKY